MKKSLLFCLLIYSVSLYAVELTENNASLWSTFAVDGAATTTWNSSHPDSVKQGNYSILFDTQSGFETGLAYPGDFPSNNNTNWDVTNKALKFQIYAINTNQYGFQEPVIVRLYSQDKNNYFEFRHVTNLTSNSWLSYEIPLDGSDPCGLWNSVTIGNPSLTDIDAVEFQFDTWDSGFQIYLDAVEFVQPTISGNGQAAINQYNEYKTLVVVLRNHAGNVLNTPLSNIQNVAEATSLFYWKHSQQSLHVDLNYLEITQALNLFQPNSNVIDPGGLGAVLSAAPYNISNDTYDAVVAIAPNGGNYGWAGGANNLLGKAGFCHFYWGSNDFALNRWVMIHEFNHLVDGIMVSSGNTSYPHNHPGAARVQGEFLPASGPDADLNAQIIQSVSKGEWLSTAFCGQWGTINSFTDNDQDGFADNAPNLPMDESRFGSLTSAPDSDFDGLSDLEELYAGVHNSTDPLDTDTDNDTWLDGYDPQPLYATLLNAENKVVSPGSTTLSDYSYFGFTGGITVYAAYDNQYFHLAINSNPYAGSGNFQIHLDLLNDGLFNGKDNLYLQFYNNQLSNLFLRDGAGVPTGNYSDYLESVLPVSTIYANTSHAGSRIYLSIPKSSTTYDFPINVGDKVGFRIHGVNGYQHVLEKDDYLEIGLGGSCVTLQLKAVLEGVYQSGTSMRTDLGSTRMLLPGMTNNPQDGQPYDVVPWSYPGQEGLGWTETAYPGNVVDWVLVSLRADTLKASEVYRTAAILLSDGTIVPEGSCAAVLTQSAYYVVVEHRNHMAAMSPAPVQVVNRTLVWDFTTQDGYANFGAGQKEVSPGVWALYACDVNQISDVSSYDINLLDKQSFLLDNGLFNLYLPTDFDLNGDVNGLDAILFQGNNGTFSSIPK